MAHVFYSLNVFVVIPPFTWNFNTMALMAKLFDGLFFVVWLICMYRNVLLYQRETSTHKAAKSVGAHV